MPHFWVAAVVEGVSEVTGAKKEWTMVHLDICGVLYDETALVSSKDGTDCSGHDLDPELFVPLKVFATPEYEMVDSQNHAFPDKLVLKALLSARNQDVGPVQNPNGTPSISLQPTSNRFFRCFHKDDTSSIEATPLATYLKRQPSNSNEVDEGLMEIVKSIQTSAMPKMCTVGAQVRVCNIQSKPELNGRKGTIHSAFQSNCPNDGRIPIMIKGLSKPVKLKPTCIKLTSTKPQYQTKEEIIQHKSYLLEKDTILNHQSTKEENNKIMSLLTGRKKDPAVQKAIDTISSGQMAFSKLGDPEFKRRFKKLLKLPLSSLFSPESIPNFEAALKLSNDPKATEAIENITLLKAAKEIFGKRSKLLSWCQWCSSSSPWF